MIPLRKILLGLSVFLLFSITSAHAQEDTGPSSTDLIILFTVSILVVIGIIVYISREIILRKKTSYDEGTFASQKNRDYEKYHSEWTDDEIGFRTTKSKTMSDEEFEEQLQESGLPDCYKILGVKKNATKEDIKERYRILAKEFHPDKSKTSQSEEKMAEINKAYEILSDDSKRERYDKFLDVT